ncbi:hypothetical protein HNP84_009638 [Thermocatellispora tengchongensis]|uniref:Uncharacterized protein n=1 Tax=Thermocatellispora tengchongensis TaxID=1073253 RepID=A0A840PEM4_9ACTN|nr:hypothetical protein [Thermocatellispora tengchongensis]MBB5139874.1 hypothetical protein [Thermocatellispora tengchongensis]
MFGRRRLLALAAGAAALAVLPGRRAYGAVAGGPLADLALLPEGAPDRRAFAPAEQRYAPYLKTLAPMVNDIEDVNPDTYGFMAGGWWRTPAAWYNARVQEHVYTMAWFYANARPWNPYAGDPALLAALDAALGHYLKLQHDDGSWPEYSPNEHGRAPTGFGLGYLSKTLEVLRGAGALPERQEQIRQALRKAMAWFLDLENRSVWPKPLDYANQNTSGLAGAGLALKLDPDPVLRQKLTDAIAALAREGQSPAGYFYEPRGTDMNYNFEVMLPEMAETWHATGDPVLVDMTRKFTDWLGYNLIREPDGSGYICNVAISARSQTRYYDDTRIDPDRTNLGSLFVPEVPELGAFFSAREDLAEARAAWAADPTPVAQLAKQDTSPRILAHAPFGEAMPSRKAKRKAVARLPYLKRKRFVELREDLGQQYLYVRRPGLYLGGHFGTRATSYARMGLTFLWHPEAGMVVHSLNNNNQGCWGTVLASGAFDANGNLAAEFSGFDDDVVGIRYRTPNSSVVTEVSVSRNSVRRVVTATSAATEQIPLILHPTDVVSFTDGTPVAYGANATATANGLDLRRGRSLVSIRWGAARAVNFRFGSSSYMRDGKRLLHVLRVPHEGALDVTVELA